MVTENLLSRAQNLDRHCWQYFIYKFNLDYIQPNRVRLMFARRYQMMWSWMRRSESCPECDGINGDHDDDCDLDDSE